MTLNRRMNVLQITVAPIFPPENGGKHRCHGLMTGFLQEGDSVRRISQGSPISNYIKFNLKSIYEIGENYDEYRYLNPLYDLASLPILFNRTYSLLDRALALLPPPDIDDHIRWCDLIIVEGPWQMNAMSEIARDSAVPLIFSSHDFIPEKYDWLSNSLTGKFFYNYACKLEKMAVEAADLVVCTSKRDRDKYISEYSINSDLVSIPNGTYSDSVYKGSIDICFPQKDITLLFVGGANRSNVEGIKKLLSNLEKSNISNTIRVIIVGDISDSLSDLPEFASTTGFVDDIGPYFEKADICINPVLSGGGTNIKMFDYLGRGVPTITTPFGARGLDIVHRKNASIREIDEFDEEISWMIQNQDKVEMIAKNGRNYVRENHVWEKISKKYREKLIDHLEWEMDNTN